jgi:hypothetical protein
LRRGDYRLRDITQERHWTGSNLLIIISSPLEGEVQQRNTRRNALNTPNVVEALNEATFGPKADTEKYAGN